MRILIVLFFGVSSTFFSGCASTGSGAARATLDPALQAVDGFAKGYKRGNPVRNAFNTYRR
jgi:hypothetical protein